jgi:preprotein translocase subunit YajC
MILDLIGGFIVIFSLVALLVVSYGKQQEKHKRHKEWMKENLKQGKE